MFLNFGVKVMQYHHTIFAVLSLWYENAVRRYENSVPASPYNKIDYKSKKRVNLFAYFRIIFYFCSIIRIQQCLAEYNSYEDTWGKSVLLTRQHHQLASRFLCSQQSSFPLNA